MNDNKVEEGQNSLEVCDGVKRKFCISPETESPRKVNLFIYFFLPVTTSLPWRELLEMQDWKLQRKFKKIKNSQGIFEI